MKLVSALCAVATAASVSLVGAPVGAQSRDEAPVTLVVVASGTAVTADQIRARIGAELGAPVLDPADVSDAPDARGTLFVDVDARHGLHVTFRDARGGAIRRDVAAPDDPTALLEAIALVAGNLARDEVSDLLAGLTPPHAVRAAVPVVSTPPVPPARPTRRHVAASISFAPVLSSHGLGGDAEQNVSLNVFGGYAGALHGFELGAAFNVERDEVRGAQIAGAVNVVGGPARGVLVAGALNAIAGPVHGLAIAGALNVATALTGTQLAPFNVAGDVAGVQLGAVNIARDVRGVQIGAVNIARDADVAIGAVSIVARRPVQLDVALGNGPLAAVTLRHGSRFVQNVYSVALAPPGLAAGEFRWMAGGGLGTHFVIGRAFVDVDALVYRLFHGASSEASLDLLVQTRVVLGLQLFRRFAVYGALSLNVLATDRADGEAGIAWGPVFSEVTDGTTVKIWPALQLGLRI